MSAADDLDVIVCRGCCCGNRQKHPTTDHDGQLAAVLTEQHGRRIPVLGNEFGETGIDDARAPRPRRHRCHTVSLAAPRRRAGRGPDAGP